MQLKTILKNQRNEILQIAQRYGAHNVRVFGSAAHGNDTQDSDIDFLVDLEKGRSIFDLGGLVFDLQKLLNRKVDVVTEKGLHWYIKSKILREAEPL